MIDDQYIFNYVLSGASALFGFLLTTVWNAVKDLQKADQELATKVNEIEVLVAGTYLKKEEFNSTINALFAKLDRIEDKLDKKVDK